MAKIPQQEPRSECALVPPMPNVAIRPDRMTVHVGNLELFFEADGDGAGRFELKLDGRPLPGFVRRVAVYITEDGLPEVTVKFVPRPESASDVPVFVDIDKE